MADDLPWVHDSLREIGGTLPEAVASLAPDPVGVALVAVGLLAFGLAVGAFLVGHRASGAFALLAAATTGWFLFPYAEVPWATVFTGQQTQTVSPPTAAWTVAGAIVMLATLELVASAREGLLSSLATHGFPAGPGTSAHRGSRTAASMVAGGTVVVGGLAALVYAVSRDLIGPTLIPDPDLLWVPVVLGAIVALVLWLVTDRG